MAGLNWYLGRLRAMTPAEIAGRARQKVRQWADAPGRRPGPSLALGGPGAYPRLPDPQGAPPEARQTLRREADALAAGRWPALGWTELAVDDPPRWQRDYLAGVDVETSQDAFRLNHRQLPGGADIRLIWELSRWQPLTRLAQAAYVLGDRAPAELCLRWIEDWVERNPVGRGWNWTSPLEAALRLLQWVWIDALLGMAGRAWGLEPRLERLGRQVLPGHVRRVWRHRSIGSSANNHLLGELSGVICALARWPGLAAAAAPLEVAQAQWEREVAAQFAPDGGNREQALHYHLFAWELCLHAREALRAAGRPVAPLVEERLARAGGFLAAVAVPSDPWDYGDSDEGVALPLHPPGGGLNAWTGWLAGRESEPGYWLGAPERVEAGGRMEGGWLWHPDTGMAMRREGDWTLRWDASPLGYLGTAAHGHLDALHVSVWRAGVALVVDPGTGAYFSGARLRKHLASWQAHNGPHPAGLDWPKRLGTFLWGRPHAAPWWRAESGAAARAGLSRPEGETRREVRMLPGGEGWEVQDAFEAARGGGEFCVCWQFAPGTELEERGPRRYVARRGGVAMEVIVDDGWARVTAARAGEDPGLPGWGLLGTCAPAFRHIAQGPVLHLTGAGYPSCVLRTTFIGCPG